MNNIVKDLRKQLGLTQEELGKKLDVSRQTINSLEKGKYMASLPLAFKISKLCNKPIEEIFLWEE